MVDDDEGHQPTVSQQPTVRGVGPKRPSDPGIAQTLAPSEPDPPRPRARRETGIPDLDVHHRYKLGETLGRGGQGEVLLALDQQIGREVAVKRIRAADPSAETLARFVREARVQGRLEHPAVVPVHDLAVDRDGRPFFVMKRLSGKPMSELIALMRENRDDAPATRRRLLRAFADVCLAVELAHTQGIIHRDLKPANVMLGDFGEVYVLDWGVARAVADADEPDAPPAGDGLQLDTGETRAGTILGTPAYMAPEQLAGERAGPAADIFALGCILFEIVASEGLFKGPRSIASQPNPRPSARRPDAPPELDAICERALALDPAARYPSARAMHVAVQAFLDGDRDVAARKALAVGHVDEARAALANKADELGRRKAIRAAGRALALDPTLADAADIITTLMLEPPPTIPAEVEARMAFTDAENARAQGRLAALSFVGYLAFLPLLVWTGIDDMRFVVAFAAVAMACGANVYLLSRRHDIPVDRIYISAVLNAVLIGMVSRLVGPFIITPSLAAATLIGYAAHPKFGRVTIVGAILGSGVAIPWLLEVFGVLDRTYAFRDGKLELSSDVIRFSAVPVQLAFALLLVLLLVVVAAFSRTLAHRQRDASQQLELQAWHLRQIVPTRDGRR